MTEHLSNLPYIEAHFDKHQQPTDPAQTSAIEAWAKSKKITDLIVISHGWNNDIDEARQLYAALVSSIAVQIAEGSGGGLLNKRLGVVGIFWPSKKFADANLIPGGAASTSGGLEDEALLEQIDSLLGFFDAATADESLEEMRDLAENVDWDPEARERFFRRARSLIGPPYELDPDDREEIPDAFFSADTGDQIAELFDELKKPDPPGMSTMSVSGGAAGLMSLSGFKAGAQRLLNYLTYYQMKDRARKTGVKALQPLLRAIRDSQSEVRIHLVGHSFGGLVVTSAAWGGDGDMPAIPVTTLTLLQAAFSHNGFGEDFDGSRDGRYRNVLTEARVTGPTLVTHTRNDKAVGIAYALASRLARQDAAGIGGPDDRFGGIGANGAQHTPESIAADLMAPPWVYHFESGRLYNLLADEHIEDHSDVCGEAVANAVLAAIAGAK